MSRWVLLSASSHLSARSSTTNVPCSLHALRCNAGTGRTVMMDKLWQLSARQCTPWDRLLAVLTAVCGVIELDGTELGWHCTYVGHKSQQDSVL